jgi:hypothetical protein
MPSAHSTCHKPPNISESVDWARSLVLLGVADLDSGAISRTLPVPLQDHRDIEHASAELDLVSSAGRDTTMTAMTPDQLTQQVISAYAGAPEPRLRELFAALIRHLHAFAVETQLTPQEWMAGIEFLTATGQKCDAERQEFILLSDVLGLSSLVDLVNAADGATESTVPGSLLRPGGASARDGVSRLAGRRMVRPPWSAAT